MLKQQMFKKKRRKDEASNPTQCSQEAPGVDDLQSFIAHRAYELYEHEGCCHGHDHDHWLQAEQEILSREQLR